MNYTKNKLRDVLKTASQCFLNLNILFTKIISA